MCRHYIIAHLLDICTGERLAASKFCTLWWVAECCCMLADLACPSVVQVQASDAVFQHVAGTCRLPSDAHTFDALQKAADVLGQIWPDGGVGQQLLALDTAGMGSRALAAAATTAGDGTGATVGAGAAETLGFPGSPAMAAMPLFIPLAGAYHDMVRTGQAAAMPEAAVATPHATLGMADVPFNTAVAASCMAAGGCIDGCSNNEHSSR